MCGNLRLQNRRKKIEITTNYKIHKQFTWFGWKWWEEISLWMKNGYSAVVQIPRKPCTYKPQKTLINMQVKSNSLSCSSNHTFGLYIGLNSRNLYNKHYNFRSKDKEIVKIDDQEILTSNQFLYLGWLSLNSWQIELAMVEWSRKLLLECYMIDTSQLINWKKSFLVELKDKACFMNYQWTSHAYNECSWDELRVVRWKWKD